MNKHPGKFRSRKYQRYAGAVFACLFQSAFAQQFPLPPPPPNQSGAFFVHGTVASPDSLGSQIPVPNYSRPAQNMVAGPIDQQGINALPKPIAASPYPLITPYDGQPAPLQNDISSNAFYHSGPLHPFPTTAARQPYRDSSAPSTIPWSLTSHQFASNQTQEGNSPANATKIPAPPPGTVFPWQLVSPDSAKMLDELERTKAPNFDSAAVRVPAQMGDFLEVPLPPCPPDPLAAELTYAGKQPLEPQRPWLELWNPFYERGIYAPAKTWFGKTNIMQEHFLVYGDYRLAGGYNRNNIKHNNAIANQLNLDFDLKLTGTERFHAFVQPLNNGNQFTRLTFDEQSGVLFEDHVDFQFENVFFEGDLGQMYGGFAGLDQPFDLPFTVGLVPFLVQNGVWMNDVIVGGAFTLPAKHSAPLRWSNFDATFFAGVNDVTNPAFQGDDGAANVFGTFWFIEAYDGYIETGYAYLHDTTNSARSHNNLTAAYTRRYFDRFSNSVRVITNFGQDGSRLPQKTADGVLVLVENSLITSAPSTFIPYCNLFVGVGRPQSVARAGIAGGVLLNTGINFETDGLTNYPTLDATAANTFGGAVGINMLGANFGHQLVLEFAALGVHGNINRRAAVDDQYAIGARYQKPLTKSTIIRTDFMYGILQEESDIFGARLEWRWKF